MKKVTRKSLDELARIMPVISEENQQMYVGGTSGYTGGNPPTGTTGSSDGGWTPPPPVPGPLGGPSNPYSIDEAIGLMDAGHWGGGYVSGWGYVSPEVEVSSPSGDLGNLDSVPNINWDIPSGDYGAISGGSDGVIGTYPNDSSFDLGSVSNPYSYNQAIAMMSSGTWTGGYVIGHGYMAQEVNITPSYGGGGGGGGVSDSSYVQPGNTGSCLGDLHPDTGSSHPPYNDDMSVITGVAPGATPEEIWAQTKYAYFRLAKEVGIDLYSLDKRIHVSSERSAKAWVDNVDRSINLGNVFFQMNIQDRLAVLIHEYTHLGQNTPSTVVKDLPEPVLLANGLIPPDIDKYIRENYIENYPNSTYPSPELQYNEYLKQYNIASPNYYENEINAYLEEKRLCPNVSTSYAREREFRIWYYSELLKISQEYYFYK